ncbi:MAG: hypothetical protein ABSA70_08350 [Terriglobia bacterium]
MDNDAEVLNHVASAATAIDLKYRRADFESKLALKDDRDKTFDAYSKARMKLLEEGVICTEKDVREMADIRAEIGRARKTQSILVATGRFLAFLAKVAA